MTDERFQQIERIIEDAGRCDDPVRGVFETSGEDEDVESDLDPKAFLGLLGITATECAEYLQRRTQAYELVLRSILETDQPSPCGIAAQVAVQAASRRDSDTTL